MKSDKKIGVSLSGGGFRAAVYHLGTLSKLREMGVLDKVDVISTISGGSITGACYGLYGHDFEKFEKIVTEGVKNDIINKIIRSPRFIILVICMLIILSTAVSLLVTRHDWLTILILGITFGIIGRYQFRLLPVSKMIAKYYDKYFFQGKNISEMNQHPVIAINATNLETGRLFTFSQLKMEDPLYEYPNDEGEPIIFNHTEFPVATAVSASASVPFAFTPVRIKKDYYKKASDLNRAKPVLVDGGVYDNQGIHKITQRKSSYHCDIIITSDAENLFKETSAFRNMFHVLMRTSDIFMNRIKDFQMIQNVFENYRFDKREVAYQVMGWDLDYCLRLFIYTLQQGEIMPSIIKAHGITDEEIKEEKWDDIRKKVETNIGYDKILISSPSHEELQTARGVKINIKALTDKQIHALMKQAACLTEVQVRLYCPTLW